MIAKNCFSKHIPYLKRKQKECKSIYGLQTTQVSNYTILAKFMNQQNNFLKNWSLLCSTKKDIFIELYKIENVFIANIFLISK